MSRAGKAVLGLLVGGLYGALIGALMLGVPAYQDTSSSFLGPARDWAGLAVLMGGFFGVVEGAITGTIIGAVGASKGGAMLIGAAAVFPLAAYLLLASTHLDREIRNIGALSLPAGALLGLLIALTLRPRRRKREP